jgi:DNA-binding PadR family transcriptional regulator
MPGPGKRFFARGDLKYALLELLQERPMHGYELMKTLQERTGGRYAASPGSVYPTLQMLEDRDFVTSSEVEGKKVYAITEAGRAYLAENRPEGWRGPRHGFWHGAEEEWAEAATLWQELRQTAPLLGRALQVARHDPEQLQRLRTLLKRIRSELADIAGESRESYM